MKRKKPRMKKGRKPMKAGGEMTRAIREKIRQIGKFPKRQ